MSKLNIVRFAPKKGISGFHDDLKKAIENYFASNDIAPTGNGRMVWKTVAMFAMYVVPFFAIVLGVGVVHPLLFWLSWIIMGFGMVGLGTSVMHDGNHGAYTGKKLNDGLIGGVIHMLGGYAPNWRIQHNILHHTYTNIEGLDEDIDPGRFLRFSPHAPHKRFHRFQQYYAWFLYGLMTIMWCTTKDYKGILIYNKKGLLKKERLTLGRALIEVSTIKVLYYAFTLVLPLLFSGMAWWAVVLGFIVMHFIAGVSLACIFQLAHVMEEMEFPMPDDARKMDNNWAVHQVLNTVNFAPKNKFLSWFIGGLNFQIEHHLFPHICHVHYPKLSPIVQRTAEEHGINYQVRPTFREALMEHGRMLKILGRG